MTSIGRVLKIVVIGDGTVGKTCLLMAYTQGVFSQEYIPTVFDNHAGVIRVDDQDFNYTLWDTAGQEAFDRCRILSYSQTSVFLVCFSVVSRNSFANVKTMWMPEIIRECGQNTPAVLVGTKSDLRRETSPEHTVTKTEAKKMAHSLNMYGYVECSAKLMTGCDDVFQTAVRATFKKRAIPCVLL
ncbi:ras-like GTP-binding protein RhoL [Panulirus ornatus]|uniref:ras-like GTP-binding protein RhoL n=1 Tax=Panulirus ornatus TaxID=150431 RepID=UPI003A84F591